MKLHYYPHPLLDWALPDLAPCGSPDGIAADAVLRIAYDMETIMRTHRGIGLAANQCGGNYRIFVTLIPGDHVRTYINPRIVELIGDPEEMPEGCLSFPGVQHVAKRAQEVIVEAITSATDYTTSTYSRLQLEGLAAQCAQHEIDHLDGTHFGTALSALKRDAMKRKVEKAVRAARRL